MAEASFGKTSWRTPAQLSWWWWPTTSMVARTTSASVKMGALGLMMMVPSAYHMVGPASQRIWKGSTLPWCVKAPRSRFRATPRSWSETGLSSMSIPPMEKRIS